MRAEDAVLAPEAGVAAGRSVVAGRSDLAASLHFGYGTNEIGFGGTVRFLAPAPE